MDRQQVVGENRTSTGSQRGEKGALPGLPRPHHPPAAHRSLKGPGVERDVSAPPRQDGNPDREEGMNDRPWSGGLGQEEANRQGVPFHLDGVGAPGAQDHPILGHLLDVRDGRGLTPRDGYIGQRLRELDQVTLRTVLEDQAEAVSALAHRQAEAGSRFSR